MIWVLIVLMALAVFGVLAFVLKLPRSGWELAGAALLVGIAGYALQAHHDPSQPGAPKAAVESAKSVDEAMIEVRKGMASGGAAQDWLVMADGLSRAGRYESAAGVLGNAVKKHSQDADLWIALGNALVAHGDGLIGPAAQFAFQKAADISPEHPGPPFFFGLALAQSGRLPEARAIWQQLLERSPPDAPWRSDLTQQIARVDAMLGPSAAAPEAGAEPSPAPSAEPSGAGAGD